MAEKTTLSRVFGGSKSDLGANPPVHADKIRSSYSYINQAFPAVNPHRDEGELAIVRSVHVILLEITKT